MSIKDTKQLMFKESVFSIIKKYKKTKDSFTYQPIITYLKQTPPPLKLCCNWLSQLQDCIPVFDRDTEQIVVDTLQIPWQYGERDIEHHLQNFILSLVTSHNYYVAPILDCLFKQTVPAISEKNSEALHTNPFQLSEEQQVANYKTLKLIQTIYLHVPLCQKVLLKTARSLCPYFKRHVHIHAMFTYNLLLLAHLLPDLRKPVLEMILTNCIRLDLHAPRTELEDEDGDSDNDSEDLFSMEMDEEEVAPPPTTSHPIGHTLDILMTMLIRYVHLVAHGGVKELNDLGRLLTEDRGPFVVNGCRLGSAVKAKTSSQLPRIEPPAADEASVYTDGCECRGLGHDVTALRQLYIDLKQTLVTIVLPTHASAHVQFLIFYTLALRPALVSDFLDFLKGMFEGPSHAAEERKSALAYLGSILARARFVKFSHIHSALEILRDWCRTYLRSEFVNNNKFEDLHLHNLFYVACQTVFYAFTFNYKEYTESKGRLKLAQSLQLDELVLSPLNPLRFCSQAITVNFAAITCHFQLAYCYSVMANNLRLFLPVAMHDSYGLFQAGSDSLDMYFPFDPYLLKRSHSLIVENYREFEGLPDAILRHSENASRKNGDEFSPPASCDVMEEGFPWVSPQSLTFTFGTSPALKGF